MAKTGVVLLGKSYNSSRIVVDLIFSCIALIEFIRQLIKHYLYGL